MKVCIAGSRDFCDYDSLCKVMKRAFGDKQIIIISGHAKGADELGERFANENNLLLDIYPADWRLYRNRAGAIRNAEMAQVSDCLVAFWDGESRGTKNMIKNMKKLKKPVLIYNYITRRYEA